MFWRKGATGAVILAAAMAVAIPASASASVSLGPTTLGPCTIGNPSSCYLHPRPNVEVFCGRERAAQQYQSNYDFRGCRVRIGGAEVKCGTESGWESRGGVQESFSLSGCVVTFGVNRVLVGCENEQWNGSGSSGFYETCGASPVATCDTTEDYNFGASRSHKTCGREPLVVRCVNDFNPYGPGTAHYCELVIGPSASPIFSCRLDQTSTDATLADLLGCVTGIPARRRLA